MSIPGLTKAETESVCQQTMNHFISTWYLDTESDHFWQKSNQVVSFFQFAKLATQAFGTENYDYYQLIKNPYSGFLGAFWVFVNNAIQDEGLWTDDYGWGGIAALDIARYLKENNIKASPPWDKYRDCGIACLQRMNDVANFSNIKDTLPVPNGTSNQPFKPDPTQRFMKNTVANALYFNLSMRAFQFLLDFPDSSAKMSAKTCIGFAYDQFQYFEAWFKIKRDQPPRPDGEGIPDDYWHTLVGSTNAMVEERPVAFDQSGPPIYRGYDPIHPYDTEVPWTKHGMWSGDQGIFVGACAHMFNSGPRLQEYLQLPPERLAVVLGSLKSWFVAVVNGVEEGLANGAGDHVLREAPFDNLFYSDSNDYVCGRGVLARFFTAPETLKTLRAFYPDPWPPMYWCYCFTANVVSKTVKDGQLSAKWNPDNDKASYDKFIQLWGDGDNGVEWNESITKDPIWYIYCTMMGLDLYGAWISMNPDWLKEEKHHSKGV